MSYRCIYKDRQLRYSVYRGERREDLVLVATLPGSEREIAIRLVDPEPMLFIHYTDCFADLVEDFVASWESRKYRSRLVSTRHQDDDTLEIVPEPGASPNGGMAQWFGNSGVGGGPPSVS